MESKLNLSLLNSNGLSLIMNTKPLYKVNNTNC